MCEDVVGLINVKLDLWVVKDLNQKETCWMSGYEAFRHQESNKLPGVSYTAGQLSGVLD